MNDLFYVFPPDAFDIALNAGIWDVTSPIEREDYRLLNAFILGVAAAFEHPEWAAFVYQRERSRRLEAGGNYHSQTLERLIQSVAVVSVS